ncbi:MAG: phosphate ABC transporter substrate-binding protein [Candidatus Fermentibacteraceae bacterium]
MVYRLALTALIVLAAGGLQAVSAEDINIAGSTTVQPLAELFGEAFEANHDGVRIIVQGGGSSVGVRSAVNGTADIGNASREVKDSEFEAYPGIVVHTVARDGIAIVTHPDVPVDGLTLEEARAIFAGRITSWSELGGPDRMITVIAREEGSGTRAAFEDMVMDEDLICAGAMLLPSNGAVRTAVSTTPDCIGFLSFGYLDDQVKAIAIDGVEATVDNASNGTYPVVRPLNMITDGEPAGMVAEFLEFALSADGQAIVEDEGYIAVR